MAAMVTKILVVEDNPGDVRLLQEALREIPDCVFEVEHRLTLTEAVASLEKNMPDMVLCDLGLPDASGLESVQYIREAAPSVALVVLTVANDTTMALEALKAGAQDYLVKQQIDSRSLARALRYAMERQRVHLEAMSLSMIDELTGLNNWRGFLGLAKHYAKVAYRTGKPFLLAFIDLDGMKHINDTFGHQEGNRALVDTSNLLRDSFRQSDILARVGGDEFAVLIADAGPDDIETVTQRLQKKIESLNAEAGRQYPLSFSVGISAADITKPGSLETLLAKADEVMYEHKQNKNAARKLQTEGV
jgi:two-component system, cell cycle response regulator